MSKPISNASIARLMGISRERVRVLRKEGKLRWEVRKGQIIIFRTVNRIAKVTVEVPHVNSVDADSPLA